MTSYDLWKTTEPRCEMIDRPETEFSVDDPVFTTRGEFGTIVEIEWKDISDRWIYQVLVNDPNGEGNDEVDSFLASELTPV